MQRRRQRPARQASRVEDAAILASAGSRRRFRRLAAPPRSPKRCRLHRPVQRVPQGRNPPCGTGRRDRRRAGQALRDRCVAKAAGHRHRALPTVPDPQSAPAKTAARVNSPAAEQSGRSAESCTCLQTSSLCPCSGNSLPRPGPIPGEGQIRTDMGCAGTAEKRRIQ